MCAIVGCENDDGVFAQAIFLQCVDQSLDAFVHVADHVAIVIRSIFMVAVFAVGRGEKRRVNGEHWIVSKKRFVTFLLNKLDEKVGTDFRAVRVLVD